MSDNGKLIRAKFVIMGEGGDRRFRPSLADGLVNMEQISHAHEFYHVEFGSCTRVTMNTGDTVEIVGLDLLLSNPNGD